MLRSNRFLFFIFSFFLSFQLYSQTPSLSKQEKTFEVFWSFFDSHYSFFDDKNIDWDKSYEQYRHKVSPQTTDDELFNILCEMVAPMGDSHVNIKRPGEKNFSASRESRVRKEFKGYHLSDYYDMVDSTLYAAEFSKRKGAGSKVNDIPLFDYSSNDNYGYLRINRCSATSFYFTGRLNSLEKIIKQFQDKDALIIDLRFNPGGTDNFSFKVAGRFTERDFLGHYKQERIKNGGFSELESLYVKPKGKTKFLKPVIILTNDITVSAADVFVLVMKELPQVTIMGENSNGSFSDMYPYILPKKLPNGWKVTLSSQRYLSTDKINYEGKGVPVDIKVLNMRTDIETKSDSVLKRALSELELIIK